MNFVLPKPKLGDITAITITTPDLDLSLKYYRQLGFSELYRADFPFPWIQVTDGALLIMLRKDPKPYIALTYYVKEMGTVVKDLEQAGIKLTEMPTPDKMIKRFRIESPDGLTITLVTFVDGFIQPAGPTMLTMSPQDYTNPDKYVNKVCGMFGEFAHPVKNLDASVLFWEKLGFNVLSRFTSPYPWAIISDGLSVVGLHQTSHFTNPTITFFAKDMKEKIESLQAAGLSMPAGSAGASGITLTTPEQQKINLFKLGM
jgi:catechol 2,3-dioxygenase-like lactoylglutathione lyase family enzyme